MQPSKTKRNKNKKKKKASPSHPPRPPSANHQPKSAAVGGDDDDGGAAKAAEEEEEEEKKALNWLAEAFASASIDQIASAYCEAGCDAYKAAGILASNLDVPRQGAADLDDKGSQRRSRRPKRVVSATSGMVSNVIGKGYSNEGRRGNNGTVGVEGKGVVMKGSTYSLEEAEEFLCSMLGNESELGIGVVKDVLGQCRCDIGKALDVLLDMTASSFSSLKEGTCQNDDRFRKNSSGICPEISSNDFSKNIITSRQLADNNLEPTYHLPEKVNKAPPDVEYGTREQLLLKPDQTEPGIQHKVLESLFNTPDHRTYEPNHMNWKKVVKKVETFGQGLEFCSSSSSDTQSDVSDGTEDLYEAFRSASRQNWDTMRTYYHKAAMAYSRGERAHASYLSEKGKFYHDLARVADEKASRNIFEARNREIRNTVTIDLHGQHAKQAIGLVKLHLLLFSYIPSVQFLKVITGCGADGVGKGKLKRSVLALAAKEGIECVEENVGTLLLRVDRSKVYSFVESDNDSD